MFDFRFGFLAKNQYQRWGSHQISLKSSCIFVNSVFLRVLIRPAGRKFETEVSYSVPLNELLLGSGIRPCGRISYKSLIRLSAKVYFP